MEQAVRTPGTLGNDPGERIRQIYFELQGVARVKDPEERGRILEEYRAEIDHIGGGLKSTISGDIPGLSFDEWVRNTPGLSAVDRAEYRALRDEWKRQRKAAGDELRRLRSYREKFFGSMTAFSKWFDAPSDRAVSEIFEEKFKVADEKRRITWKGRPVDAILFAKAAGISTAYFNATFVAKNGRKFQDSALKPDRRKNTGTPRDLPEIVKVVARFHEVTATEITKEYNTALLGR